MAEAVRAGACVVDITPGVGIAMGGYGARQGVAAGIHDPLNARTLVLDDGGTRLVLAVCDLVGVPSALAVQVRTLVERECGIPPDNVCVSATHTHSGPLLRTDGIEDYLSVTARTICGSVQVALARLEPVTLKLVTADVTTISQNRRHPDGPIESLATILLAAPEGGGRPVATLVNHACHATVLEHDNLLYSADFPGAMARAVEQAVGGTAIFMQGAAANINPVWMRHDFAEVERIGGILAGAAARAAHELRPLGEGQWGVNLSWSEMTPKEPAPGTVLTDIRLAAARQTIDVSRRPLPSLSEVEREIREIDARLEALHSGDVDARRAARPRLNALRMDRMQILTDRSEPGQTEPLELQAFRVGDECAIAILPGEFFVELGNSIRRQAGVPHLLICGYANATAGYFPTIEAFAEGGYEAGRARFVPEAGPKLAAASAKLVQSLAAPSPVPSPAARERGAYTDYWFKDSTAREADRGQAQSLNHTSGEAPLSRAAGEGTGEGVYL